jgi:hypothetical protein
MLIVALFAVLAVCSANPRFNCTDFKIPPLPKNISFLHPGHVSIAIAMGDSITAAFAARGDIMEDRDLSWSIGVGSPDQMTFPWLASQYSSHASPSLNIEGMSTSPVIPNDIAHLPHNDYHPKTDHLNVAESEGAVHRGSLEEQWSFLLGQFPKYENFQSRWKVFTLWMTANDVCGECNGPIKLTDWTKRTQQLLVNVSKTLTNVYVNLVSTLDLSNVARIQRAHLGCKVEHEILNECGCIDRGNATQLQWLDRNVHTMNAQLHTIAAQWYTTLQQQGRSDMAVVVQGFQEGIGPTLDRSFLSKLDCFHPSAEAHQDLGIGLWNSMLCTTGRANRCDQKFTPDMPATCPTVDSVFYTGPDVVPGPPVA